MAKVMGNGISVTMPLESWVKVQDAMKWHIAMYVRGTCGALPYPLTNQDFMHALAKIQLAIDGETL